LAGAAAALLSVGSEGGLTGVARCCGCAGCWPDAATLVKTDMARRKTTLAATGAAAVAVRKYLDCLYPQKRAAQASALLAPSCSGAACLASLRHYSLHLHYGGMYTCYRWAGRRIRSDACGLMGDGMAAIMPSFLFAQHAFNVGYLSRGCAAL